MSVNWSEETMEERMYAFGVWLLAKEIDPYTADEDELAEYAARFGINSIDEVWEFLDEEEL